MNQSEDHNGHTHSNHNYQHNGGYFQRNIEIIFSLISGLFLAIGFGHKLVFDGTSWIPIICYVIAYFFGGVFTTKEAYDSLVRGQFEIDFLMLVAAIGAAILGEWAEGALLLFLFSLGHALEHHAMNRARKAITALADLAPQTAILLDSDDQKEISVAELKVGDRILIKPNSKISADGMVINGQSEVNQAPITGESMPVNKYAKDESERVINFDKIPKENQVFAGTINGSNMLIVRVMRVGRDSTLARLISLVQEAESQKSPTQLFTDRFEKYFVPAVLIMVTLLMCAFLVKDESFSQSFYRAMAVLVASSPCALAISTPSAVLAGVARAARAGLLIKGGRPLEDLGAVRAIAFDKTGTLTEGKPQLTHAIPFEASDQKSLLEAAVAVELLSDHPLADAIVEGGKAILNGAEIESASQLESLVAKGVKANYLGGVVHIGNRRLFQELFRKPIPTEIEKHMAEYEAQGHTSMIVHHRDQYLGVISVMDIARPEAKETLAALKKLDIEHMVMLTGDHQNVAEAVAQSIGITNPLGSLMPEDKVNSIETLKTAHGKVAMVGDGVNDAPAMANSTVGIAMGAAGSDVALETADIALLGDQLNRLPFAIKLSRQTRKIIKQNLFISLGMVAILVPLTISGIADIGPAVIGHEGSTLVVVLNALRLLGFQGRE
jgi:Cd2+/Zn2+-exporting ATPase